MSSSQRYKEKNLHILYFVQLSCHVDRVGLVPDSTIRMECRLLEKGWNSKVFQYFICENILNVVGRERINWYVR